MTANPSCLENPIVESGTQSVKVLIQLHGGDCTELLS